MSGAGPQGPTGTILERLTQLHPKVIDLSLGRIEWLLKELGDPHLALPPVFHVAGTNGKGSTCAFLRAILEASGRSVHVYTSPHLVHFHERIVIAGEIIGEERLADVLARCERANAGRPITFFEITTAAAFLAFAETRADAVILEVGLGGRLDATNVIREAAASIITPVDMDHMEYLGSTIEAIALEKAGILKRDVPGIIARQGPPAMATIEAAAALVGAPLFVAGTEFDAHEEHGRMVYQDTDGLLDLPRPRLVGAHQIDNAGLAIAALRRGAPFTIHEREIARGLETARWPARLQRLTQGPLIDAAPDGADIWLDGAHNVHGARALAAAITAFEERAPRPLYLITGILKTKDAAGILEAFGGIAQGVYTVPVHQSAAGHSAGELYDIAARLGLRARPAGDVLEAVQFITDDVDLRLDDDAPPRILIMGSLYLAGEVLAENA